MILYLGIGTAVYPAVVTGYCVHILPYISTKWEIKKWSREKKEVFPSHVESKL